MSKEFPHFCANCRKQAICPKKEKHLTDERRYDITKCKDWECVYVD